MLVLSRKCEESVVIGGSDGLDRVLKITVLSVRGNTVKLGFEVDADIPVHRSEVWERLAANSRPNGPTASPAAVTESRDRWEDDAGGPAGPPGSPIVDQEDHARRQRRGALRSRT